MANVTPVAYVWYVFTGTNVGRILDSYALRVGMDPRGMFVAQFYSLFLDVFYFPISGFIDRPVLRLAMLLVDYG